MLFELEAMAVEQIGPIGAAPGIIWTTMTIAIRDADLDHVAEVRLRVPLEFVPDATIRDMQRAAWDRAASILREALAHIPASA